jgi:hypothetical protein
MLLHHLDTSLQYTTQLFRRKAGTTLPSVIFISCGQFTENEKKLGRAVCDLINELTSDTPYFAENQSSLSGLNQNIFNKLGECAGFIAIMHPRGTFTLPDGRQQTRGSVWIEQEIAIAAFLAHSTGRDIKVVAYIHESVNREGLRDLLQLNPQVFRADEEVLKHLREVLKGWSGLSSTEVELSLSYEKVEIASKRHDYQLSVKLQNHSQTRIDHYQIDVLFPNAFLDQHTVYALEIPERRTPTHRLFRVTERSHGNEPIHPEDSKLMMTIQYFVNDELFYDDNVLDQIVTATLFVDGARPQKIELPIRSLQVY